MSKLYETVEKIINAETIEEAENLLYGKDGIPINTKEHYQRIISNFIKKKELIISKNGNEIYFNLDQNISDAWDMIFISEYIQKQIEDEIDALTKEAQRLKSAKASKDEIDKIRQAKNELSNSLASIRKISDLNRITVNSFKPHDNIKAEITKLKEAINVIEKIRGSFEHQDIYGNNNSVTVDKVVEINNPKVKLNVKIPIEYLDGFTKGRIIAREEDKIVLEKTNNIVSPILKELGYDISKIESFFYNVDPDVLAYLLNHFDNDITKLYEMPLDSINSGLPDCVELIKKVYGNNIDITKIPFNLLWNSLNTMNFIKFIKSLNIEIDITKLHPWAISFEDVEYQHLPGYTYKDVNHDIKKLFKKADELKTDITSLPAVAYLNIDLTIKILELGKIFGVDFTNVPDDIFCEKEHTIENMLKNCNFQKNKTKSDYLMKYSSVLPNLCFLNIDEVYEIVRYLERKNICIKKEYSYKFFFSDKTLSIVNYLKQNSLDLDVLKLSDYAIHQDNETIKLIDYFYKNNIKIDVTKLSDFAFIDFDKTRRVIDCISAYDSTIDITKIQDNIFMYPKTVELFTKKFINKKKIDITKFNSIVWSDEKYINNMERVFNLLESNQRDIDITQFDCDVFYFLDSTLTLLDYMQPEIIINYGGDNRSKNTDKSESNIEYDFFDLLMKMSGQFRYDKMNDNISLLKLLKTEHIDIKSVSSDIFLYPSEAIQFINNYKERINFKEIKFPDKLLYLLTSINPFNKACKNLDYLLDYYNNDLSKIEELPREFFTYDLALIDVMLQRYNSNIARSIFGINNPKIISLLIYMNNVFSGYNVNNTVDIDMTDYIVEAYEPSEFLKDTLKDTIAYRNNIKDVQMDPVKFFEQFGYGPSKDAIVNTLLERLRNASCHYRIKPVRDRNGNLIDDKVYIFDEDNYGNNNFNIILDIDEALELTRKVEIALEKSLDKDDDDPIKSKKAH